MHLRKIALGICLAVCSLMAVARGPITFQDRVAAQEAIERVYYAHRIWPNENPEPKPAFEQLVPRSVIEAKVNNVLAESAAVEALWQRPISAEQLQAEMDRMAKETHDPATLSELFQALGNAPDLIAECLARPALADREIRNWYAFDLRFHGDLREKARGIVRGGGGSAWSASGGEVQRTVIQRAGKSERFGLGLTPDGCGTRDILDPKAYETTLRRFGEDGRRVILDETAEAFVIQRLLSESGGQATIETLVLRKDPFDRWWERARSGFPMNGPEGHIESKTFAYHLPDLSSASTCTPNSWDTLPSGTPRGRSNHCAVWTGTEMIVWGGIWDEESTRIYTNTGGRYNPATDTWVPMFPGPGTPVGRADATAVWTGTQMIVWGGWWRTSFGEYIYENTGGRYDPATDSWAATPDDAGSPSRRWGHVAVWTGTQMLVWGGEGPGSIALGDGAAYTPGSDAWTPIPDAGAPHARVAASGVWTGSEMIVWGGYWSDGTGHYENTGGRFNPTTGVWTPVPAGADTPSGRYYHTAVWTGSQMVIYGGKCSSWIVDLAAKYDPALDLWSSVPNPSFAGNSDSPRSVWTGTEMIVWGESGGSRYTPGTNSWTPIDNGYGIVPYATASTVVWTGGEMIVWGGWYTGETPYTSYANWGGRYSPGTNTWIRTAAGGNVPEGRIAPTTVWTGQEMIVWGGNSQWYVVGSGGRFDPSTSNWSPTSLGDNVPSARAMHTAVWTGTEMIVWGGWRGTPVNTGGRYRPVSDSWLPTSIGADAPSPRLYHAAVWTGNEMVVWGGMTDGSGGRYNPGADNWTPTSTGSGLPSFRFAPFAFWTGHEMLVWGGRSTETVYLNTGGLYDPVADTWRATSNGAGCPDALMASTAVWDGSEMIVWGGQDPYGVDPRLYHNAGAKYDPGTDAWIPTGASPWVPAPRAWHYSVWTGNEMLVWGGGNENSDEDFVSLNDGGMYIPGTDSWSALAGGPKAPRLRTGDAVAWTGSQMILWGGGTGGNPTNEGSILCPGDNTLACTAWADTVKTYPGMSLDLKGGVSGGSPPYAFDWNFGDGSDHGTDMSASHTYDSIGSYTAFLGVTDAAGGQAHSNALQVSVRDFMRCGAYANPTEGSSPLTVHFRPVAYGGIAPYTYAWTFGDGTHSIEASPDHVYSSQGYYGWTCWVTDAAGASASASGWIAVSSSPSFSVQVSCTPDTGFGPTQVAFGAIPSGGTPPYTYSWTFGDFTSSTEAAPTHLYSNAGRFQWSLSIWDASSHYASAGGNVAISSPLALSASAYLDGQLAPAVARFASWTTSGTLPYAYDWTFGDGSAHSNKPNPTHTYAGGGSYSWQLAVTDGAGQTAQAGGTIDVTSPVVPPVVASVTKLANPFRLKIAGGNFHPGCSVTIDGSPVEVKYKSDGLLVAKNCKALVPKGVTVQIVVTNSDDGGHSDPFAFSR